jgi:hypothetical protein
MDFEVVEKEIKYSYPTIKCFICEKIINGECSYGMLQNTFYCQECSKDLPNLKSAIDIKFMDLNKKVDDLINGMVDKNSRLKILGHAIDDLKEEVRKINDESIRKAINLLVHEIELEDEDEDDKNIKLE